MTIHLPKEVENNILAAVNRGRYESVDAAMTEAACLLLERLIKEQVELRPPEAFQTSADPTDQPIWKRILERSAAIPDEEWDKLPVDGAEQHDHYLYGVPKRPAT
jgi:Arc/MetJ-type ribon-helix-helix transcriptional regulator